MKAATLLDENLPQGLMANASACIISGLFDGEKDVLGQGIEGKDITYIPITKIPFLIFKLNNKSWLELYKRARRNKLKYMLFTKEAQQTTNYQEYIENVKDKSFDQVNVIGLGVFGEDKKIDSFSGNLALLR